MLNTETFELTEWKPKIKKSRAQPKTASTPSLACFTNEPVKQYIGQNLYIKPNYVVSVAEWDTPKNLFSKARCANEQNLRDNKHSSSLSKKAQGRIRTAVNWLVASAKEKTIYQKSTGKKFNFKVNLVTLTLPDTYNEVSELVFKRDLMHPFLVYAKKYWQLNNYIWKLEFQQNGKLHVHLTTDTYIDLYKLRNAWNRLLKKNGLLGAFMDKYKHDNPNSTDVHSVWKVKNLGAYIAKYLSKNEQNDKTIKGRIWGCNYELSDKNKCHVFLHRDEVANEMRSLMKPEIDYKEILTQDKITGKVFKQCEIFFLKLTDWKQYVIGKVRSAYDNHRFYIRNGVQPAPI